MMPSPDRPRWEVADVFRRFGASYEATRRLPFTHRRVMQHIKDCRTAALGGHLEECDSCGHQRPTYNSCRDRHCPKCQTMAKEKWLEARKADLLPVDYFHKVFTIPHAINALTLANKRVMLGILFAAVAETLLQFGRDPRSRIGGRVGFTLVLHTWNQKLLDHFHLHCVIPAGALSDDGQRWIKSRNAGFLFSVKALGIVFRAKFIARLRIAFEGAELHFPGDLVPLAEPRRFELLLEDLTQKNWVVYSKAPFGGPEKVLEYLGRYTHRVAISNHRIVDVNDQDVSFAYQDRADGNQKKTLTLTGHEFVRRFLLHVLPSGFTRIRHYGFLASRGKKEALTHCRAALGATAPRPIEEKTATQRLLDATGVDVLKCPHCPTGRMLKCGGLLNTPASRSHILSSPTCLNSS